MIYLVTPHGIKTFAHVQTALSSAAKLNSYIASQTGGSGGADCWVVADRGDELSFRGMACGRRIIGPTFGCGPGIVERVRQHLDKSAA